MEKNQEKQFQCTGDCLKCSPVQRQYCSSQIAYNNLKALERLEVCVEDISKKIEMMEIEDAPLINPMKETTQEGDGV